MKNMRVALAVTCLVALTVGCSSTRENKKPEFTKEAILQQPDVMEKKPVVYGFPIETVRKAGLRALTWVGCEIKKQEPFYLRGSRPHKFGLFVGSGGEKVEIFLYPKDENTTLVWIDTDLTFRGIEGQQGWDTQVLTEMNRILTQPAPAK